MFFPYVKKCSYHVRLTSYVKAIENDLYFTQRLFKTTPGLRSLSSVSSQGLPKKKEEYGRKGPISYKTLLITAGLSGALLAFMLYVRREKETGNHLSYCLC